MRAPFSIVAMLLLGCASVTYVEIPQRSADLYPDAQTRSGVSVAIDEMRDPARVQRYFGAHLLSRGVLPIQLIVSNSSDRVVRVGPADVLLLRGGEVIDPLPVEIIAQISLANHLFVSEEVRLRVEQFFEELAMQESLVIPGGTYSGIMFFAVPPPRTMAERYFRVLRPFPSPRLQMHVAITELEENRRIRFGPYGLYD